MAWNSQISAEHFELLSGKDQLGRYAHTPLKYRVFCKTCGTHLYSYREDTPDILRLRLGTVTVGEIPAPTLQYFSEQKPEFIETRYCQPAQL